ncbi:MAG TPA: aldo/keto reductase, partial [Pyrinomonadaceae bacterium]|nr:aldo/keto reductase [Pyrinomonadaceae bacterium]
MPVNRATAEGTKRYRERFAGRLGEDHFRQQQGLTLSSIGIGTYLGNPDTATDAGYTNAVVRAVQLGCNVIDSAANYRFQRSERSIGDALRTLSEQGFAREELVICTKGGYLPFDGAPPRNVREYVNETFVKPGIASFEDIVGGSHCMTATYLQSQLDQSLRNMGLECVDVYYIHNPESQLGYVSEQEFYSRLKLAFERLEQNRTEGKLAFYGVATWNGFRAAAGHHSLVRMVELARQVGGEEHGFRFIQLPFNLAMPEATANRNETLDGEQLTVVDAAQRLGVTVVASASLLQGRIDPQTAIQFARSNPGITTALIGMSRVEHVEENL